MITDSITILYVSDQERSKNFYRKVLQLEPVLDHPGMTEFRITEKHTLGIMPEKSIVKILKNNVPNPEEGSGIPRCELYLRVDRPEDYFDRAVKEEAKPISEPLLRDWNEIVAYAADLDGHVLAFAKKIN